MAAYRNFHQLIDRQRGITLTGLIVLLLLFSMVVLLSAKFIPVYFEAYEVSKTLESLKTDNGVKKKPEADLVAAIQKRLSINEVHHAGREHIVTEYRDDAVTVRIAYEVRVHLIGNLDVVASFDKHAEIPL